MMMRRLSDDEITAVLRGMTPPDRPDLAPVGAAITRTRQAFEVPTASARLTDVLEGVTLPTQWSAERALDALPARAATSSISRRRRTVVRWFLALGLAGHIGVGSAVAVAATAGAGFAGLLPDPAQRVFDRVLITINPVDPVDTMEGAAFDEDTPRPEDHLGEPTSSDPLDRHFPIGTTASPDAGDRESPEEPAFSDGDPRGTRQTEDAAGDARDAEEGAAGDARDAEEEAAGDARDAEEEAAGDARDAEEEAAGDN